MQLTSLTAALVLLPLVTLPILRVYSRKPSRTRRVAPDQERVLILGASSGVGRALALQYAARGAKICIVARGEKALAEVRGECEAIQTNAGYCTSKIGGGNGDGKEGKNKNILAEVVDFANLEGMIALREKLKEEWRTLDTLAVVAGVSALRPLLETAGVSIEGKGFEPLDCTLEGLQEGVRISNAALQGNFTGPLLAALTFIPFLSRTSSSPSVLLLSSLASVIPAPTRALYASTKGATLLLYQSLAIEHPDIAFTHVLPATIEGDFRASAVDGGPVRESNPNLSGLKRVDVARRCITALDAGERTVFISGKYRWAHLLYWILPGVVERGARKKYNFVT